MFLFYLDSLEAFLCEDPGLARRVNYSNTVDGFVHIKSVLNLTGNVQSQPSTKHVYL